ncbi:GspE/PulE family protein [Laspinema olomoucense]|uniref:Flp pilus assembly complex ATPase component TadA n=1 Tax=Laspinema olomoucense D3b TaxID=2953688 RepID=A0ABT2N2N0_9CYAN|nr:MULTISPECIES: type II/IV secretion system protein [unclassified Laspinema]MCT7970650.1 Flp pilus assembly complex ATPase component TadA [Laspinema sp. D3d]MCT7976847.1 Flp pilus assembly complex ATPase component TadA [Laspinema sp. D3b]MCT7987777.1 Flp pilus assembly complex ATPase component TadA [Laspinema sp. D3a]MCT7996805.1 Flp pilus assembly complex ATPase component TadA [Laspinema sp. D3c]
MTNFASQRRALVVQNAFSPFGNKLIQAGYADREQVQRAHIESRKSGKPLTEVLEAITGKQLPPELLRQYKKQQLFELKIVYGVEALDPEITELSPEQLGQLLDTLLPLESCRRHRILPISRNEGASPSVSVAMVDPDNLAALDDLTRILRPQGLSLRRLVITPEDYQQLLNQYSDEKAKEQQAKAEQANKLDLSLNADVFNEVDGESLDDAPEEDEDMNLDAALRGANDAPIINTVNKILAKALSDGVSDIHVEPQEEFLRVRMRKDGVLHEFARLPNKITAALTSRFKIISDMDIAERRNAQDGRIRRIFQGRTVDFRVNCLPSRYGEKLCLRILDNSSTQLGLDKLISNPESLAMVREMASRPFGLILVTGPTGSGKSTSLYSVLAERNDPSVNISTAEDPIEYALPGITQCQVIRAKGLDFTNLLRAFMRQDPDIILVGETRDKETAKTAIEAALTGHLVLTTLHTNDAAGAIARLDEMGVEPFMVAGSLIGVLAQRLMRRVCSECRIAYTPTPEELGRFGLSVSGETNVTFYKANVVAPAERKAAQDAGTLCQKCGGGGYKGRVGVYEVLKNTENLQMLISQGAPTERIKEAAVEEGMITLLAYSLNLVREGHTTFEEVERVTFTDSGLEAELKAKRKTGLTCKACGAGLQQEWLDCLYCLTPRFQE